MKPIHHFEPALCQALIEQLPDAVVFADRDGVIRAWNEGAEAVFGFAASEVLGLSLDVIIPERLRASHWEGFRRAIASGETRHANQVRTTRSLHKDGRKLYVDLSFGVVTDGAGAVAGAVAVGRDGSQRYLSQKALQDRLAALEAKQQTS
jgi:PAS domain S-box-containing protein